MCGLIGYSGARPADPQKIKLLMIYNMDRGEDATGWAYNNKVEKDSVKVSRFLAANEMQLSESDENYTIIAHARKASSGYAMRKELAHPFGVYKNGVEKEQYDLILAMNGTLTNHDLLAKTHEVPYSNLDNSDTQTIARIMAKLGEKEYKVVMESYNGSATLLFFSPKFPNVLMAYKDPAKDLFFWQKSKDEMYVSSIEDSLLAAGAAKVEITACEDNHLYRINKGKITKDEVITRNPLLPKYTPPIKGDWRNCGYIGQSSCGRSSSDRDEWYEARKESLATTFRNKNKNHVHVNTGAPYTVEDGCAASGHKRKTNQDIYVVGDKYFRTGHPAQGVFKITDKGKVKSTSSQDTDIANEYYFMNGYMCKDKGAYDELVKRFCDKNGSFQLNKMKVISISQVVNFFKYPVLSTVNNAQHWVLNKEYSKRAINRGDQIDLEMFLSDNIEVMVYEAMVIPTTRVDICTPMYNKPKLRTLGLIDGIEGRVKRDHQLMYLRYLIEQCESSDVNVLMVKVRTEIWKTNSVDYRLREYFYTMLLELLLTENIINKENFTSFGKEGSTSSWEGSEFIKSIEDSLKLLKAKIEDEKYGADSFHVETFDKLSQYNDDGDIVKSVQNKNPFYKMSDLINAIYEGDYPTLEGLAMLYVKSADGEGREYAYFYESIILHLSDAGMIELPELLLILNDGVHIIKAKANELYNKWLEKLQNSVEHDGEKESVDDKAIGKDEDISTADESNWEIEDVEKLFKERLGEVVATMKDILKEGDIVGPNMRSKTTDKILKYVEEQVVYLEARIKNDKLLETWVTS